MHPAETKQHALGTAADLKDWATGVRTEDGDCKRRLRILVHQLKILYGHSQARFPLQASEFNCYIGKG